MTWQYVKKGNKIFVYHNGSWTPCFTFERKTEKGHYIGHGLYFMSLETLRKHIEIYGKGMLRHEHSH